jgi:asparagine synthase (glutamine-hydrolysing)
MNTLMQHGGPDDEGVFCDEEHHLALGHRRLSLIDLSACGHQPMSYAEGRFQVTYNGEIYNYRELKEELKGLGSCFKTNSDTEVILAAFAKWGAESFNKLNGMFAFALWDSEKGQLYLVRDPSGIKPLYYALTKEGLAFASEVRALQSISYLCEENPHWKVYLMAYGFLPEPITTLKNVQPLRKGSWLCYDSRKGTATTGTFHRFEFREQSGNRSEVIELIKDQLQKAVKRHLIADAPIGVFLSGGIDSGILALLAGTEEGSDLNTLSIYLKDEAYSEKKYQDIILQKLHCHQNQFLLTEEAFHQNLPSVFKAMDQPGSDGINTWFISKYAKENRLKAVLSGIGADELYGGYPSFGRMDTLLNLRKLPNRLLRSGRFTRLKKLRRMGYLGLNGTHGKYLFLRGQFIPFEIASHLQMDEAQVWKLLEASPQFDDIGGLSAKNQASSMEMNIYMQNQLLKDADVMSMAHGVEIRVPFLDKEFINMSLAIKSDLKYAGSRPKQLLIDSFKDILPAAIWNRPKMGFSFPFASWLVNNEFCKDIMGSDDKSYHEFISGNLHWSQFLSLVLIKNNPVDQ